MARTRVRTNNQVNNVAANGDNVDVESGDGNQVPPPAPQVLVYPQAPVSLDIVEIGTMQDAIQMLTTLVAAQQQQAETQKLRRFVHGLGPHVKCAIAAAAISPTCTFASLVTFVEQQENWRNQERVIREQCKKARFMSNFNGTSNGKNRRGFSAPTQSAAQPNVNIPSNRQG
ncbi:hypothetical protein A4A49_22207 [Nicotiana attenuata]|uniref:Uncharacterized protein n=1 Tax=Nicotiana attenuata TaxID=49451 RepID=A0A1J6IBH5_NICAT|nr:hypothetical protein A4A49_22207 [Nicotiana attenuata]